MEVGRFILAWCVHGYWLHAFCVRPLIMGFWGGGGWGEVDFFALVFFN